MSIQFACPSCQQPIEVDDEHGGQTAACPYCRRVISVPNESTLGAEPQAPARPMPADSAPPPHGIGDQPSPAPPPTAPPPPGALHVGPPPITHRIISARRFGNYALICTGLVAVLFIAMVVQMFAIMAPFMSELTTSQPDPDRMQKMQSELGAKLAKSPLYLAFAYGSAFFALVGLVVAIVSLKQSTQSNWRGIVALIICGLWVLCFCGGNALQFVGGGLAPPALGLLRL